MQTHLRFHLGCDLCGVSPAFRGIGVLGHDAQRTMEMEALRWAQQHGVPPEELRHYVPSGVVVWCQHLGHGTAGPVKDARSFRAEMFILLEVPARASKASQRCHSLHLRGP